MKFELWKNNRSYFVYMTYSQPDGLHKRVSLFADKNRQEKFYGDKKLSFNVFEYIIVSKYIFDTFLS